MNKDQNNRFILNDFDISLLSIIKNLVINNNIDNNIINKLVQQIETILLSMPIFNSNNCTNNNYIHLIVDILYTFIILH